MVIIFIYDPEFTPTLQELPDYYCLFCLEISIVIKSAFKHLISPQNDPRTVCFIYPHILLVLIWCGRPMLELNEPRSGFFFSVSYVENDLNNSIEIW